jgi:NADPH:quinone reductase-like Zn-dependent oxidoreductase
MYAAQIDRPGPPGVIELVYVPPPRDPGPTEVVVEVSRMGINGADLKTLAGWFPHLPYPRGLGREFSGMVIAVGSEVVTVKQGQMVLGTVEPAMQEQVVVDQHHVMPIPAGCNLDIAACLPVAGQTAWEAVQSQDVHEGDVCVVSGASGGVGHILTQLLVDKGARVIAIAREKHHERLDAIGAIPLGWSVLLADEIEKLTPKGIHHVFDQVGIPVIEAALALGVPHSQINSVSGFADIFGVRSVGRQGLNEIAILALSKMMIEGRLAVAAYAFPFEQDTLQNAFTAVKIGSYYGKSVLSTGYVDHTDDLKNGDDGPW